VASLGFAPIGTFGLTGMMLTSYQTFIQQDTVGKVQKTNRYTSYMEALWPSRSSATDTWLGACPCLWRASTVACNAASAPDFLENR